MLTPYRITGLPSGTVDTEQREVQFEISVSNGKRLPFVTKIGPLSQIISGLAKMRLTLQDYLLSQNAMETTAAEEVAQSLIHKERWSNKVLMVLTTPQGVPYTFALPLQTATEIADQLKIESAKPTQTGHA